MYLLKHGEITYVFAVTFDMETTLTNEVPDIASETVVCDAFGRVSISFEITSRRWTSTVGYTNLATEVKILPTVFHWFT